MAKKNTQWSLSGFFDEMYERLENRIRRGEHARFVEEIEKRENENKRAWERVDLALKKLERSQDGKD